MRVYSVRLPVAAPAIGRTSSPEGVANVPAGRHDSSHLEGQLAARTGEAVTHASSPVPVSGNRITASP